MASTSTSEKEFEKMKKTILHTLVILTFIVIPTAFAGRVDLTTYYPAPYGEYKNLKSTESSYFATSSGNVGIGGTAPAYKLQLWSDSAAKPVSNTWTIASDSRIKKDIRPFTDGLSVIKGINPVWYKFNGLGGFKEDGKNNIGVIAQDIVKVAPYTINTYKAKLHNGDKEDTSLLNFNSHALTGE